MLKHARPGPTTHDVTLGFVPVGPKDAQRHDTVSAPGTPSPRVALMVLARDGDIVAIRAFPDGEDLIIKDNHPSGTSSRLQSATSKVSALDP